METKASHSAPRDICTLSLQASVVVGVEYSITVTVNTGALPACETAYLFVFDSDNNPSMQSYPVDLVTGQGDAPCPPKRLQILR